MKLTARSNLLRESWGLLREALPPRVRKALRQLTKGQRIRRITSLDELDGVMAEAAVHFARSDEAGRAFVAPLELSLPFTLPADPESAEYREAQFELYRRISGRRDYSVQNELSAPDIEGGKRRPFPYLTESAELVGDQLIAQGFLVKAMNLAPRARVVEFGPGWGHTTHHFLQLGYEVTAVEVDAGFGEIIAHRSAAFADRLTVVKSDMLEFTSATPFDAAIFFESFHHCADHLQMIDRLGQLVSAQGCLVFAAEPICDLPYPWGVRVDGLSLWSMRKYGWLELGFEPAYFEAMLQKRGWRLSRLRSQAISTMTDVVIARRA